MHLLELIIALINGIFIILSFEFYSYAQITKIGIVNSRWKNFLEPKLRQRNWLSRCRLYDINVKSNISFYESINTIHDLLVSWKIDVVIGDSRLDVAQAAAYLSIPFIAFDSELHVKFRPEYDNMPHFYALPVSEDVYALATFDILNYFKIIQVAIIIDETVDYKNFIQPFFERKSLFSKVWTIMPILNRPINQIEAEIDVIMKDIRQRKYIDIIVKTSRKNLIIIMEKARFYGMISEPYRWYLPSFVCENFNLKTLKHIYSNFTFINEECTERYLVNENNNFFEISLINQFFQIIRAVNWNFKPDVLTQKLKSNSNAKLSFNEEGTRNQFTFIFHTISRSPDKTLSLIGSWQNSPDRAKIFNLVIGDDVIERNLKIMPSFMKIIAVEEHPHLIVKENNTLVGFGVDLINKLSKILKFNYSINVVDSYGEVENGRWNGLVGELIYGRADMSLGPVVQTREREEILDFSTTFKQREISLVMKKPSSSPSYFQFLGPFSPFIWLCVVSSIVVVTIILWIVEHFHDKYFPEKDRLKFNMKESSWFILASTLQGGTENVPFSIPGRILTATLYFFVIIIVTSYTANLAAFLTVKAYSNPIKSVDDLISLPPDSDIKFGTVQHSAIHDFFKHSEISTYQKIYRIMTEINDGWLVNSSSDGYKKSMLENYVFIWDDSVNQYEIFTEPEYKCQLYIVGRPFGKRSFAIGMPQGSCYKETVNTAILNLLESGTIENLEHKWWKSTSICVNTGASSEISSGSLTVQELAGVFLVLVCGIVVSLISLLVKIFIYRCKPLKSLRNCCNHFFSHLPLNAAPPPIIPANKSNINRLGEYSKSNRSTIETKSDTILTSPGQNTTTKFTFDFADDDNNSKDKSN